MALRYGQNQPGFVDTEPYTLTLCLMPDNNLGKKSIEFKEDRVDSGFNNWFSDNILTAIKYEFQCVRLRKLN